VFRNCQVSCKSISTHVGRFFTWSNGLRSGNSKITPRERMMEHVSLSPVPCVIFGTARFQTVVPHDSQRRPWIVRGSGVDLSPCERSNGGEPLHSTHLGRKKVGDKDKATYFAGIGSSSCESPRDEMFDEISIAHTGNSSLTARYHPLTAVSESCTTILRIKFLLWT